MSEFTWNGESTANVGDLFSAMCVAFDEGRAAEFMAEYRRHSEHADSNIGYIIGYAEPAEKRDAMWAAFQVRHPVFG